MRGREGVRVRGRRLNQNTRALSRAHTHSPPAAHTLQKRARAQVSHIGKQMCNVAVALTHRARCRDREGRGVWWWSVGGVGGARSAFAPDSPHPVSPPPPRLQPPPLTVPRGRLRQSGPGSRPAPGPGAGVRQNSGARPGPPKPPVSARGPEDGPMFSTRRSSRTEHRCHGTHRCLRARSRRGREDGPPPRAKPPARPAEAARRTMKR